MIKKCLAVLAMLFPFLLLILVAYLNGYTAEVLMVLGYILAVFCSVIMFAWGSLQFI
jgi:hypothetical protein